MGSRWESDDETTAALAKSQSATAAVRWYVVAEHQGHNSWTEHYFRDQRDDDDPHGPASVSPAWTGWIESRHRTPDAASRALARVERAKHGVAVETRQGAIRTLARHLYISDRKAYDAIHQQDLWLDELDEHGEVT